MSNLASSVRVRYEPLRSLSFSDITGSFAAVGTPFANPVRILKVTNLTDEALVISFDGINDHDIVPANGFYLYDYTSNQSARGGLLEQPQGDQVYVVAAATLPTIGYVFVTVVYASNV